MSDNKFIVTGDDGEQYDLSTGEPQYWMSVSGHTLELVDYPTDGPLFRVLGEEDEEFEMLQLDTEGFRQEVENGHFRPVPEHLMAQSENDIVVMFFGAEASDHIYQFEWSEAVPSESLPRMAWLQSWQQMGETYSGSLDDVPQWIIDRIEDEYNLEVVHG